MLLIEQNLGVAIDVADRIGVMVNGRIAREMPAAELAADRELQERLLGVRAGGGHHDTEEAPDAAPQPEAGPVQVLTVRRAHGEGPSALNDLAPGSVRGYTRWNAGGAAAPVTDIARRPAADVASAGAAASASMSASSTSSTSASASRAPDERGASAARPAQVFEFPVAASSARAAYVAGTFDTKGRELTFIRQCLEKRGLRVVTVDLSTSGKPSTASVHPREVARHHPERRGAPSSRRSRHGCHGRWRSPSSTSCVRAATSAA